MGYFITVGVHAEGAAVLESKRRHRYGLKIIPTLNPWVTALFPPDDRLFLVTQGGCSCSLYPPIDRTEAGDIERKREKYRAMRWSEAKITRALEAKQRAHQSALRSDRADNQPRELTELLLKLSACPGGVRVFAHFYSGGAVDKEQVIGRRGTHIEIGEGVDRSTIPEDLVVDVVK